MTRTEPATRPILVRALCGEETSRAPFWFMRQAGRYLPEYRAIRATAPDFVAFCLDPEKACEVTLQPLRRFGMDAAILFADILLVPHALGAGVAFKAGEGPVLDPVRDGASVARLEHGIEDGDAGHAQARAGFDEPRAYARVDEGEEDHPAIRRDALRDLVDLALGPDHRPDMLDRLAGVELHEAGAGDR
jgi:hypothetical protein